MTPTISAIVPGSPAEKAKLQVGQTIVGFALTAAAKPLPGKLFPVEEITPPIPIMQKATDARSLTWPMVEDFIQDADPSRKVKLFVNKATSEKNADEQPEEVTLEPVDSADEYALTRGLSF